MPCFPKSQSRGFDAVSKFVRRVMPQSNVGSSRREMGEKRVSSRALGGEVSICACLLDAGVS